LDIACRTPPKVTSVEVEVTVTTVEDEEEQEHDEAAPILPYQASATVRQTMLRYYTTN
jgi:hypothetical protein